MRGMSMSTVHPPRGSDGADVVGISYTYGIPTMLRIDTHGPSESEQRRTGVHVYWGTIAAVLAVGWILAMPIGRWVTGYVRRNGEIAGPVRTGWSHPAAILGYVLVGCAVVGAVAGVVFQETFGSGVSMAEVVFGMFMLLMILAVPVTVVAMIVRRWLYRARIEQRGFAVEMPPAQA
jgi:hypothetical protein